MQIICANLLFYTLFWGGVDMHRFDFIQIDYP